MAPPEASSLDSADHPDDDSTTSTLSGRHTAKSGGIATLTEPGIERDIPPLSASWREQPLSQNERTKVQLILQACADRDLVALRELATSEGGLVEDEIRRTACMSLLQALIDCMC